MRLAAGYFKDHGWHVGRPLKYLGLLVLGAVTLPLGWLFGALVEYTGFPGEPLIYTPTILLGLLALKSLIPKLRGQGIPYRPPFRMMHEKGDYADDPLLTITSTSHPKSWKMVMLCDIMIWVLVLGGQIAILSQA